MIITVQDSFEIKAGMPGSTHRPGLIVIFNPQECSCALPGEGNVIGLQRPDGRTIEITVDEVKHHGPSRSFFFANLTRDDGPIGSRLLWEEENKVSPRGSGATAGARKR